MSQPDGNNRNTRRDSDLALIKDLIEAIESAVGDTLSGVLTENVCTQTGRACEELARMLGDNGFDRQARMADKLKAAFSSKESANAADLVTLSESVFQISLVLIEAPEEEESEAVEAEAPAAEPEPAQNHVPDQSEQEPLHKLQSAAMVPDRPVMYVPVDIPLSAIDPTDGKATAFPEIKTPEPELRPVSRQEQAKTEPHKSPEAHIRDEAHEIAVSPEQKETSSEPEESVQVNLEPEEVEEPEQELPTPEHLNPVSPINSETQDEDLDTAVGPEQIEWINESVAPELPQAPQADVEEPLVWQREQGAEEERQEGPAFAEIHESREKEQGPPALSNIINLPVVDFAPKPERRPARPGLVVYALTSDAAFVSRLRSISDPDTEVRALRSQAVAANALTQDETALLIVDIGDSPDESGPFNAQLVSRCLDRVIVVGSNFTPGEIKALRGMGVRAVVEKSASSHGLTRDEPDYEMDIGA